MKKISQLLFHYVYWYDWKMMMEKLTFYEKYQDNMPYYMADI